MARKKIKFNIVCRLDAKLMNPSMKKYFKKKNSAYVLEETSGYTCGHFYIRKVDNMYQFCTKIGGINCNAHNILYNINPIICEKLKTIKGCEEVEPLIWEKLESYIMGDKSHYMDEMILIQTKLEEMKDE